VHAAAPLQSSRTTLDRRRFCQADLVRDSDLDAAISQSLDEAAASPQKVSMYFMHAPWDAPGVWGQRRRMRSQAMQGPWRGSS